jgi:uncharacterized protein with NRDE domain
MCTLIVLRRPGHTWPLLIAGNRDEMHDRPWMPPGRHWKNRTEVVAGLDQLGGGSWLGVNDHGMVAVVMNREGTLGPEPHKRSRGELVLEALDHAETKDAVQALADLEPRAYRAFNLFVGDPDSGFWLRSLENSRSIDVFDVPSGLHMLSARELDDQQVPRIRVHLPKFIEAKVPNPEVGDWNDWQSLLSSRRYLESDGPHSAMNLDFPNGFGTVCSHLVAIPRYAGFKQKPLLLFANGPPDSVAFERINF